MADPNWRSSTTSLMGHPSSVSNGQQRVTNGLHESTGEQQPQHAGLKFHLHGDGRNGSAPAVRSTPNPPPHGHPPLQDIAVALAAARAGSPFPSAPSGPPTGTGPPTTVTGLGQPAVTQSPFPGVVSGAAAEAGSNHVSPGSGPPVYGSHAPTSYSGQRVGAGGSGGALPAESRSYAPPMMQNIPYSKPPTSFGQGGPPTSGWMGNGNRNGPGLTRREGGMNGQTPYESPPKSFGVPPPPSAPPVSSASNGAGHYQGYMGASTAGPPSVTGATGMSMASGPPSSQSMFGAQRPPPSMSAPPAGQPPSYGMNQAYANGGMHAAAGNPQPKINPDQIPRPIVESEVITYRTCTPASVTVPPPPTSNYVAIDEGNCSPRFMRSTMAQLPIGADTLSGCKIPMAVVVQPMAVVGPGEDPVPVVDFGEAGPLRCESCRAYINSYVTYVKNGQKWVCNFCKHEGAVPQNYQCPLDPSGLRRDRMQRPELCRGSVDFVVPRAVYSLRLEQQPIFVFCVDVTSRALESGFTAACLAAIEETLDVIPGSERARVGLMTFNKRLQVYRFDDEGTLSQIVVAADTEEPYAPLPPDDWVLPLHTCRRGLVAFMHNLLDLLIQENDQRASAQTGKSCACGAALRATADCLSEIGGRVFLMTQSPAHTGAGAVIASREGMGMYGGDKEFRMYQPAPVTGGAGTLASKEALASAIITAEFYQQLMKDCAAWQVCVDLMLWGGDERQREYYDVATVGAVVKATGGTVTYLRAPDAGGEETALHLREHLKETLRNHADSASETVLKVRCTSGFACTQRLGAGVENMPGELEMAVVTPHQTVVCRLEHDGSKLEEGRLIFVQAAFLYTSSSGQRRVRCHTLALPVTGVLSSVFRCADVETVCAVMARQAVARALGTPQSLRNIVTQVEELMLSIFYSYRKKCAPNSSSEQLILPETLRLLPLFTMCMQKMLALRPNVQGSNPDVRADERVARLLAANSMSIVDMIKTLYPSLYSLHDLAPDVGDEPPKPLSPNRRQTPVEDLPYQTGREHEAGGRNGSGNAEDDFVRVRIGVDVPVALPPTSGKLSSQGVFLLDSGEDLVMYVGQRVNSDALRELFGVDELPTLAPPGHSGPSQSVGDRKLRLVEQEGYEQARRVHNIIGHLRKGASSHKPLTIVLSNSGAAEEARFVSLMVEDKTRQGTSYVDQLCQLHRQIQSRMG